MRIWEAARKDDRLVLQLPREKATGVYDRPRFRSTGVRGFALPGLLLVRIFPISLYSRFRSIPDFALFPISLYWGYFWLGSHSKEVRNRLRIWRDRV